MSSQGKLVAKPRTELGSLGCRRLRKQGLIPGNIYGHKQDPAMVSAVALDVMTLIRSGKRVIDVELEGKTTKAMLREVQWDQMGDRVQHFDLVRVDSDERVEVEIHVELRGTAPGVLSGGILDQELRTLTLECLAIEIPDSIVVKVGSLEIGQAIHVRDLELPPNTRVLNNPDLIVAQIIKAGEVPELVAEGAAAQPEVIGRKPTDEEAAKEKK